MTSLKWENSEKSDLNYQLDQGAGRDSSIEDQLLRIN